MGVCAHSIDDRCEGCAWLHQVSAEPLAAMSVSHSMRDELAAAIGTLGDDEVRVLAYIAARLVRGQAQYGRLDIATDKRDWREEARQEFADGAVYLAIAGMKATVGGWQKRSACTSCNADFDGECPHESDLACALATRDGALNDLATCARDLAELRAALGEQP